MKNTMRLMLTIVVIGSLMLTACGKEAEEVMVEGAATDVNLTIGGGGGSQTEVGFTIGGAEEVIEEEAVMEEAAE